MLQKCYPTFNEKRGKNPALDKKGTVGLNPAGAFITSTRKKTTHVDPVRQGERKEEEERGDYQANRVKNEPGFNAAVYEDGFLSRGKQRASSCLSSASQKERIRGEEQGLWPLRWGWSSLDLYGLPLPSPVENGTMYRLGI